MKKTVYLVDDSTFTKCVQDSTSICQALRLMNLSFKGKAYSTFRKRCSELQLDISHFVAEKRLRQSATQTKIELACKTSISREQTLKELFLQPNTGANRRWLDAKIEEYEIDTSHWKGEGHLKGESHDWTKKRDLSTILVDDSDYQNIRSLKERLFKAELLAYACSDCGISEWKNQRLSLHLDHINGKNDDHRIENLRLLCPNCHSLTPTFCRGHKKVGSRGGI